MSDAEIRAALRLTNGDVAQAVLLLSEPLAGPKRNVPRSARDGGGVTGTRAGKPEKPSDPYRSVSRVAEIIDEDAQATNELYQSFAVDTGDLTDKTEIGSGGFGTVYRVTDRVTGKNYALKEFKSSDITNNSVIRELVMLSSVNPAITRNGETTFENSNVVGFFGASTTWKKADGTMGTAILSEFINGREIDTIRSPGIWLHAPRIARELFDGIAFIHSKGVAHGDIKPSNVMVGRTNDGGLYGRVVIVDLGLACFIEHGMANSINPYLGKKYTCDPRRFAGTPDYFAPEVAYEFAETRNSPVKLKFGNDVWAATLTLFEVFADFRYYDQFPALSKGIIGKRRFQDSMLNTIGNFYAMSIDQKDLWDVGKQGLLDAAFSKYRNDEYQDEMEDADIKLAEVIEFLVEGASSPDERPAAIEMASRIEVIEKREKTKEEISIEIQSFSPFYYSLLSTFKPVSRLVKELYKQLLPDGDPNISYISKLESILRFWKAERRLYNPHGFELDKLVNQRFLGEGTYGKVYKVRYQPNGKLFALKELKRAKFELSEDLLQIDDVRDELIMLASVNPMRLDGTFESRHVAGYIASSLDWTSFEEKEPRAMILSEFIDGKNLFELFNNKNGWPHYERIAKELFDGLSFIHSRGVAHRDIKGGNVMLERAIDGSSAYGRAVIVDLGLSCFVEQDLSQFNTEHILRQERTCRDNDVQGGTYYYQSPEIAREYVNSEKERAPVDINLHYGADVWALGMTIVEFVCGMRPGDLFMKLNKFPRLDPDVQILEILSANYSTVQSDWNHFKSVAFSAVETKAGEEGVDGHFKPFFDIISQSFLHPEQRPNAAAMLELLEGIPVRGV
jgi:serine/threonine protein kinase